MAKVFEVRGEENLRVIVDKELIKYHYDNIRDALKKHGREVKKQLIKVVTTGPRTGRFYTYRGRKYQASAPGEPPAKRSGRLSQSFMYRTSPLELIVGNKAFSKNGAPYPRFLEDGTSKMDPRPYFMVTIDSLQYQLERDLQDLKG